MQLNRKNKKNYFGAVDDSAFDYKEALRIARKT
jgi:hypothetical protein